MTKPSTAKRKGSERKASFGARGTPQRERPMTIECYGESDEDRIRRMLIVKYGHVDPRDERIYRDLDERARAHPGELVLVATRERKYKDGGGFSFETSVTIGVLKGGGLILERGDTPVFPTEGTVNPHRFTLGPIWSGKGGVELCPGQYEVVLHLDETLEPGVMEGMTPLGVPEGVFRIPMMEIAIGDLEVIGWYGKWGDEKAKQLFREMAGCLNRSDALHVDPNELRDAIIGLYLERRQRLQRVIRLGTIDHTVRDDDGRDIADDDRRAIERIELRMRTCLAKAVAIGMAGETLLSVGGLCEELGVKMD